MDPATLTLSGMASLSALALAVAALARHRSTRSGRLFAVGMILLAVRVLSHRWPTVDAVAEALIPGTWLAFSLSYSRGNAGEFLRRWRAVLALAFAVPVAAAVLASVNPQGAPGLAAGQVLTASVLLGSVFVLVNLEKTLRASAGTMRWRIKFLVLGLGVIFGALIYTQSQSLLFAKTTAALFAIDGAALLVGGGLIAIAYWRTGLEEVAIFPPRAVLQGSVTVLLAGAYLLVVGVLAHVVSYLGGVDSFQAQALLVLLAISALGVLALSSQARERLQREISRYLGRPRHDFRAVWHDVTRCLARHAGSEALYPALAEKLSQTFHALSVSIWLLDERRARPVLAATTSQLHREAAGGDFTSADLAAACATSGVFNLESARTDWASRLRDVCPRQFQRGGGRVGVPLAGVGGQTVGLIVLGDRVGGAPYALEERDLLECIADQTASAILNERLTRDLVAAQQVEAFQMMSTFVVHDLKNAAHGLTLMMANLPTHFDNPEFRADALRGIGRTTRRINEIVGRLNSMRSKLTLNVAPADVNELIGEVVSELDAGLVAVQTDLADLPLVAIDSEQIRGVVTNLVLNACQACAKGGAVRVSTRAEGSRVVITVADTGCGMTEDYVRTELFRPFRTTKNKGMGIGLFQSKLVVEAHRGTIQVESAPGSGATFRVALPLGEPVAAVATLDLSAALSR